ncbi:hypothetical protein QQS45_00705 [Alteriqipengyuania flavescens]|uniref:hypothetical protein n=1 Tax=Alteriqipengyuania flavescens TaxID=3053610 RepID=UPI0025B4E07A|nr:hypothetical protein [Alteriqipengyuania flavescens]WJY18807.1 hypothetical protein QQW98_00705 [Alteriqipengyuania flavescens]WJY24747.1 hypothetical protein QQS45_00705 [Alteriqipengyuania flavescens]
MAEVAAMGMTSIEHARDLPLDCSTFGAEYRGAILAKIRGEAENWPDRRAMPGKARDTFDQATCDAQIAAMCDNGTYYVPTLLTREMDYRAGEAAYRDDPRLAYIPAMQAGHWKRRPRPHGLHAGRAGCRLRRFLPPDAAHHWHGVQGGREDHDRHRCQRYDGVPRFQPA